MEMERRVKWGYAQDFNQRYGVPIDQLMKASTPDAMENIALKHQRRQEKQGQVPVQRFDNSRPSPTAAPNRGRRIDQLMNKAASLTDQEHAELGRLLDHA